MTLRAQAISGFRWTATVRLLSQGVSWAITLIVVRLLTPADYGLLAMATVFVSFLAMFSEMGLGAAIVQRPDLDVSLLRRVFGVVLTIHFTLTALLFLSAPLIALFYAEPRLTSLVRVLSFQFAIAAFAVIPDALLQRSMEFKKRSLLDLTGAIVASLATLIMAFSGFGVWALVLGSLLQQAWKSVGINFIARSFQYPQFSFAGLRAMLRFGGQIAISQVFWMIFSQTDILLCARWLGKEVLGFYSVAMHLASLPNQRISGLVNQVAFPAFSSMRGDIERVGRNLLGGVRILSFFAFPVLWGMSSVSQEMVSIILGKKWIEATFPLQMLTLIMPIRLASNFLQVAIQGIGRSDIILRNAVFASIVGVTLFFIGIYSWGLHGLSVSWLVVAPAIFLQNAIRGLPCLDLRLMQLLLCMLPPAASGAIMYLIVTGVRHGLLFDMTEVVRLFILVIIGAASYMSATLLLNRKGAGEAFEMVRSMLPSRPTVA